MDIKAPHSDRYMADLAPDPDSNLSMALQLVLAAPFAMVLTDPSREDNPIVFVNKAFQDFTGYRMSEAIGRNCRFLQGEKTDPRTVARMRDALAKGEDVSVDILNYRKDGSPFWNRLMIGSLEDNDGTHRYFFGIQKVLGQTADMKPADQGDMMMREIQHRVKNHLTMVVGLIRLQSREEISADGFDKLARRVESLQLLYEELNASGGENRDAVALGAYLSRIVNSVAELDGRGKLLIGFDVESFVVPLETAVRCGLIVSEAVTNAIEHAFEGRETGRINLRVHENTAGEIRIELSDDGVGMPPDKSWPSDDSLGGRIITGLATSLGGTLEMASGPRGSTMTLELPRSARGED
jgi:PAS domain S-box-containing protein